MTGSLLRFTIMRLALFILHLGVCAKIDLRSASLLLYWSTSKSTYLVQVDVLPSLIIFWTVLNPSNMAPFRAEHMGSLLRPQNLLDVRSKIRDENISAEEAGLPAIEKAAVKDVVKLQRDLGFKAVTSGEYNRTRFWGLMWDEFVGTKQLQDAEASMFRLYHPDVVSLIEKDRKVMPGDSVIAGGKLSHPKTPGANLHELKLVQESLPESEWKDIKLTVITPAWFHMRYKQGKAYTPEAYTSDADYFADVAKVYQEELDALYKAGLRNVQFDDPGMACESP